MNKKTLTTICLVLGLSFTASANAGYSWWEKLFGVQDQACHTHSNTSTHHWTRYFWWHHHCPNELPVADAGDDQVTFSGEVVSLDGSSSSDSDGRITRYRWRQLSGTRVNLRDKHTMASHFIAPEVSETEELVFVLNVRDNARGRNLDQVMVMVNPKAASKPPIVNAGTDQAVNEKTMVYLDGSNSSDPNGDIVNYLWEQHSGTAVTLTGADTAMASFTAPELETEETLVFSLTVTDSQGNLDTDSTEVSVEPVTPVSQANVRIRSVDGSLVSGVKLSFYVDSVLRNDLSTNVDETARLTLDADTNYSIKATVEGFADQIVSFRSASEDGNNDLHITLLPHSAQIVIPEGSFSLSEHHLGLSGVDVRGNTTDFVDAEGNPVSGDIELAVTVIDPNDPAYLAAFPGKFTGVGVFSDNEMPIYSWAAVDFEFSANGEPINLAPDATAEVWVPLFYFTNLERSHIRLSSDVFSIYSLAEDTSTWQGIDIDTAVNSGGSPTGFAFRAQVSRFSWFNVESSRVKDVAQLQATVLTTEEGIATLFSRTEASFGFHLDQADTTISTNSTSNPLIIPANVQTCVWAKVNFDDGRLVVTEEQCVTPTEDESVSLSFTAGSGEPLDIFISSHDIGTDRTINAHRNKPIKPIVFSPASIEKQVSYVSTGDPLPSGIRLSAINETQAELVGTSRPGSSTITITATDDEGNMEEFVVNLSVGSEETVLRPPLLPDRYFDEMIDRRYFDADSVITESLDKFNFGGRATRWVTAKELPPWLTISTTSDNRSFIITDPFHPSFPERPCDSCDIYELFETEITASNEAGHSSTKLSVFVSPSSLPPFR